MTTQAQRTAMGRTLTTNAHLVAEVLGGSDEAGSGSVMEAIAVTRSLGLLVDDVLHALVQQARSEGHTWGEIGEVLHVTRQAAFQRFGGSTSRPEPGEHVPEPLEGAEALAVRLVDDLIEEHWDAVFAQFSAKMRSEVDLDRLRRGHAQIVGAYGRPHERGDPVVKLQAGLTEVEVPLGFERLDLVVRVVFNVDGEVAGLFIVPADA